MNIENHIHNGAKTAITPNYMSQGAYLQHGFRPQSIALETIYDPVGSVGDKFEHLWYVGDQPVTYPEVIKEISDNYHVWLENGHPSMVGWSDAKRWRFYHDK